MPETDAIKQLEDRLDQLVRTQIDFQKEISLIRGELVRLRARKMMSEQDRSAQSFYADPIRVSPVPPVARPGESSQDSGTGEPQRPQSPRPPANRESAPATGPSKAVPPSSTSGPTTSIPDGRPRPTPRSTA